MMIHQRFFPLDKTVMARRVPNFIDAWTGAQMPKFKKFSESRSAFSLSCDEGKCRAIGTSRNPGLVRRVVQDIHGA
jgi:hypothetical protein